MNTPETAYDKILNEGKNDARIIDGKCSICGAEMVRDYYANRHHFMAKHGLTLEQARFSALCKPGVPIGEAAIEGWGGYF